MRSVTPLKLPPSSDDIILPPQHVLQALSIYEVLRQFGRILRLSPFRYEDFCAAIDSSEQSVLLSQIHMALFRALLLEDETNGYTFAASDEKDSLNIFLHEVDCFTWPEHIKSYFFSDKSEFGGLFDLVSGRDHDCPFPFVSIEDRLKVLKRLCDLFLASNTVREVIINEGITESEDHCRSCCKMGDLLCCENCPAVYHLLCLKPPLEMVPDGDWLCPICDEHRLKGVTDCHTEWTKDGWLRHTPIGTDREGRKYWFLSRRLFVESDHETVRYYSSKTHFDELIEYLETDGQERRLLSSLKTKYNTIIKHMAITESLVEASRGDMTSGLLPRRKNVEASKSCEPVLDSEKEKEKEISPEVSLTFVPDTAVAKMVTKGNQESPSEPEKERRLVAMKQLEDTKEEKCNELNMAVSENLKKLHPQGDIDDSETRASVKQEDVVGKNPVKKEVINMSCNSDLKMESEHSEQRKAEQNSSCELEMFNTQSNSVNNDNSVLNKPTTIVDSPLNATNASTGTAAFVHAVRKVIDFGSCHVEGSHSLQRELTTDLACSSIKTIDDSLLKNNDEHDLLKQVNQESQHSTLETEELNHEPQTELLKQEEKKPRSNEDINEEESNHGTEEPKRLTEEINQSESKPVVKSEIPEPKGPFFRLGMEGNFTAYVNQYATNPLALNKNQHMEYKERKRSVNNKFSVEHEFKISGEIFGPKDVILNTLRCSIVNLENNVPAAFMHPIWPLQRSTWVRAVHISTTPEEFGAALIFLESLIRPLCFIPVWHDALGHLELHRAIVETKAERAARKREHKEEEEEVEVQHRALVNYSWVPMHQIWKQKGEEYRIFRGGGWTWNSGMPTRKRKLCLIRDKRAFECKKRRLTKIVDNFVNKREEKRKDEERKAKAKLAVQAYKDNIKAVQTVSQGHIAMQVATTQKTSTLTIINTVSQPVVTSVNAGTATQVQLPVVKMSSAAKSSISLGGSSGAQSSKEVKVAQSTGVLPTIQTTGSAQDKQFTKPQTSTASGVSNVTHAVSTIPTRQSLLAQVTGVTQVTQSVSTPKVLHATGSTKAVNPTEISMVSQVSIPAQLTAGASVSKVIHLPGGKLEQKPSHSVTAQAVHTASQISNTSTTTKSNCDTNAAVAELPSGVIPQINLTQPVLVATQPSVADTLPVSAGLKHQITANVVSLSQSSKGTLPVKMQPNVFVPMITNVMQTTSESKIMSISEKPAITEGIIMPSLTQPIVTSMSIQAISVGTKAATSTCYVKSNDVKQSTINDIAICHVSSGSTETIHKEVEVKPSDVLITQEAKKDVHQSTAFLNIGNNPRTETGASEGAMANPQKMPLPSEVTVTYSNLVSQRVATTISNKPPNTSSLLPIQNCNEASLADSVPNTLLMTDMNIESKPGTSIMESAIRQVNQASSVTKSGNTLHIVGQEKKEDISSIVLSGLQPATVGANKQDKPYLNTGATVEQDVVLNVDGGISSSVTKTESSSQDSLHSVKMEIDAPYNDCCMVKPKNTITGDANKVATSNEILISEDQSKCSKQDGMCSVTSDCTYDCVEDDDWIIIQCTSKIVDKVSNETTRQLKSNDCYSSDKTRDFTLCESLRKIRKQPQKASKEIVIKNSNNATASIDQTIEPSDTVDVIKISKASTALEEQELENKMEWSVPQNSTVECLSGSEDLNDKQRNQQNICGTLSLAAAETSGQKTKITSVTTSNAPLCLQTTSTLKNMPECSSSMTSSCRENALPCTLPNVQNPSNGTIKTTQSIVSECGTFCDSMTSTSQVVSESSCVDTLDTSTAVNILSSPRSQALSVLKQSTPGTVDSTPTTVNFTAITVHSTPVTVDHTPIIVDSTPVTVNTPSLTSNINAATTTQPKLLAASLTSTLLSSQNIMNKAISCSTVTPSSPSLNFNLHKASEVISSSIGVSPSNLMQITSSATQDTLACVAGVSLSGNRSASNQATIPVTGSFPLTSSQSITMSTQATLLASSQIKSLGIQKVLLDSPPKTTSALSQLLVSTIAASFATSSITLSVPSTISSLSSVVAPITLPGVAKAPSIQDHKSNPIAAVSSNESLGIALTKTLINTAIKASQNMPAAGTSIKQMLVASNPKITPPKVTKTTTTTRPQAIAVKPTQQLRAIAPQPRPPLIQPGQSTVLQNAAQTSQISFPVLSGNTLQGGVVKISTTVASTPGTPVNNIAALVASLPGNSGTPGQPQLIRFVTPSGASFTVQGTIQPGPQGSAPGTTTINVPKNLLPNSLTAAKKPVVVAPKTVATATTRATVTVARTQQPTVSKVSKVVSPPEKKENYPTLEPLVKDPRKLLNRVIHKWRNNRCDVRSVFQLKKHERRVLGRRAGMREVPGFMYTTRGSGINWPPSFPRPSFKVGWRYRSHSLRTLAGAGLQARILHACLKWEDINIRPPRSNSSTVYTGTGTTNSEVINHRYITPDGLKCEYLVRKIVRTMRKPPPETPRPPPPTVSKRGRTLRPKMTLQPDDEDEDEIIHTGPRVFESWCSESELELWEVRQYNERKERERALEREKKIQEEANKRAAELRAAAIQRRQQEQQAKQQQQILKKKVQNAIKTQQKKLSNVAQAVPHTVYKPITITTMSASGITKTQVIRPTAAPRQPVPQITNLVTQYRPPSLKQADVPIGTPVTGMVRTVTRAQVNYRPLATTTQAKMSTPGVTPTVKPVSSIPFTARGLGQNAPKMKHSSKELQQAKQQVAKAKGKKSVGTGLGQAVSKKHVPLETRQELNRIAACRKLIDHLICKIERGEEQERTKETKRKAVAQKQQRAKANKLDGILYKRKEMLKKQIIHKRSVLEKELILEVNKELKDTGTPTKKRGRESSFGTAGDSFIDKKQKTTDELYCICRRPYDPTMFYIGCDLCANWFHGDCVGVSPQKAETMEQFTCTDCSKAQQGVETEERYCLCRQPYDESKFYIGCDTCHDWFHGSCVGITEMEADRLDSYFCPRCKDNQSSRDVQPLSSKDYDSLKRLLRSLQSHKMAWPFLDPVSADEVPGYYDVIKDPMDLSKVEDRLSTKHYQTVEQFNADITTMFDNCRFFNPKESPYYRCAEVLEGFFVKKLRSWQKKV